MKVVHLSSSDLAGGAAIACKRIVDAQVLNGIDSRLIVQKKISSDPKVYSTTNSNLSKINFASRVILDEGFIRLLTNQKRGRFSYPGIGLEISQHLLLKEADIINLQWINGGFLSLKTIERIGRSNKPIVWTFHDMWAFTGGCHYVGDCEKFLTVCQNCPALKFSSDKDFSNKIFNRKQSIFDKLNLTVVTTSRWLAGKASRSKLLKGKQVEIIPTPVDSEKYKLLDSKAAREKLKLDLEKKIILFGAMNANDERKGFRYLIEALNLLKSIGSNLEIELAVFGKLDEIILSKVPYKVNQLGKLKSDDDIVSAYNSADVFVAPSLEDNLPNTIMESMSCGTPVVAFNAGGIPDLVDNGKNGILTQLKSPDELASGLLKILSDDELRKKMGEESRNQILKWFNPQIVAGKYKELYNNLIKDHH